jgi:nicotinate-nucleotide adenylyltransferase
VEVPALAISSTDCRDRVVRGMPVWYLVPDGVVQYIEKRGLYRDDTATSSPTPYDRAPGSATPAGGTDDPDQPPLPHLREVPR